MQLDISSSSCRINQQAVTGKGAGKKTIPQALLLQGTLDLVVSPMVQLAAGLESRVTHPESIHASRLAFYANIDGTQPYRLTHPDMHPQYRLFTVEHLGAVTVGIVAQCLTGQPCLLYRRTLVATQAGCIMPGQITDQRRHVGIQLFVFRLAEYFQPGCPAALDQHQQQQGCQWPC